MKLVSALFAGLLFGAGLVVSQMINPAKVIGFLDFAGDWDPTLALVMIGALAAAIPGFLVARQRQRSYLDEPIEIPTRRDIDHRLVAGAAILGIGWGMAGFCPGPALAALSTAQPAVFAYVASMIAGIVVYRAIPSVKS
jgi:hypothetical protein